jgi:SAM-dependent methyltransferase
MDNSEDWWQAFYNDTLADMFLARPRELDATIAFLTEKLNLRPGSVVFDQCCGIGTLSVALAERGMHAIGVDLSESYIRRGRETAGKLKLPCDLHQGDAFEFLPDRPCDAAFNWYSSFGYAEDDRRNVQMLRRAFESLRPGGRFALDFPNVPGVLRAFLPAMLHRHSSADGEVLLVRESAIDLPLGMLRQVWTYVFPNGRRVTARSGVKLYMPHVLAEMFRSCEFVDIEFCGSVGGEALALDSPRCICMARRP